MKQFRFLLVVLSCIIIAGCRTTKYVTVPEYHKEYINRIDSFYRSDTTLIHDSINVLIKGDSVFTTKIKWQNRFVNVYKTKVDSFIRTDSIRVPYPIEKELTKWQKAKMNFGAISIGISIASLIAAISYIVWRIRKRFL